MIKLSKKGSYTLKAMIYIAKRSPDLVKIKDISVSENISENLLRRIIAETERAGLVETIKGRTGGVKLGKETNKISVYDILKSIGEELGLTDCTKGNLCSNLGNCSTTSLLGDIQKGFNSLLKIHTLDKIIK